MLCGTLSFVLLIFWIGWIGWQQQYLAEMQLAQQRVDESAVRLKAIVKAADDEIVQLRTWADTFPAVASQRYATFIQQTARRKDARPSGGGFTLDELIPETAQRKPGQLFALTTAAQRRADNMPSNLALGLSMLERVGDGLKTSQFLRWTYFNAAAGNMLVVSPWAPKADFLESASSIEAFLKKSLQYEVATKALPHNNPKRLPYWTKVYKDQGAAGLIVSHGAPVYWGNEFIGVVATDLQLAFLGGFLSEFHDSEGELLIANEYGQVLGDRRVPSTTADIKLIESHMLSASGTGERLGNNVVFRAALDSPRWTVVHELPISILSARVYRAHSAMLFLLALLMLAVFALNYVLWRMYVAPALTIAQFVAMDSSEPITSSWAVPTMWQPWVQSMTRAFHDRQQYFEELQLSYEILEQRVIERTEELEAANQQLEALSVTDPLTGAWNRRHLLNMLDQQRDRLTRGAPNLSVLMIDLDHFKRINDTYGHAAGDAVLREFVCRSVGVVRKTDMIFRYGGEEFVIMLPDMRCDDAVPMADRLRSAIADTPIVFEGHAIALSVSIGLTHLRAQELVKDFLRRADQLLYAAKQAGRNRVMAEC